MKVGVIVSCIALASCAATAETAATVKDPKVTEAFELAIRIYHDCIMDQARRLESSGEEARAVASAAVTACSAQLRDLKETAMLNNMVNFGLDVASAAEVAEKSLSDGDRKFHQTALLTVVDLRSRAKSD